MTDLLENNTLAIIASSPLTQLGIAQFIQDLHPGYCCVLNSSSLISLEKMLREIPITLLVVELNGTPEDQTQMADRLWLLSAHYPQLKIVVYTASRDMAILTLLHSLSGVSLIARYEPPELIRQDMRQALTGRRVCSSSIKRSLKRDWEALSLAPSTLTKSERNVLTHLFAGLSLSEIATLYHRSIKTISAHKCNSMRKLGVRSDAELFQIPRNEVVLAGNTLTDNAH